MENIGFPDVVGIDVMLPTSTIDQHDNMEYNNEHNKIVINGNI